MDSSPIWRQLLLQAALILVNAFFAAAEIAILSVNENVVRHSAEEGDKRAQKLLKVVEEPTTFLSTIQVGITLAGFLGSAFAADNFASMLTDWLVNKVGVTAFSRSFINSVSVVIITIILSFFTLVLGELVPKRIAMQKTNGVIKLTLGTVTVLKKILRPITWLLSKSTNAVLRLLGIDPHKETEEVSEEEIRMMVDIAEETDNIETEEKEMIENIFEFNNQTAEEVMIHRIDMKIVWKDDTEDEILKTITDSGLSRFPVCGEDADDVIGILATRDFLLNLNATEKKDLEELIREPFFVPETIHTDVLFRQMQTKKTHIAIVVDEYGGTSGLVTMEDLLECIVGNIYDEFDPVEEKEIEKLDENLWKISGAAPLDEIAEELNTEIPESPDYDTLGGLIIDRLSAIPEDNTTFEIDIYDMHIEVTDIEDRHIEWTKVSLIDRSEEEDESAKE